MSKATFKTNPVPLEILLKQCAEGKIQLPDFQRSWVWAEDRILSLIASFSSAFHIHNHRTPCPIYRNPRF